MSNIGNAFARVAKLGLEINGFVNLGAGKGDDSPFYLSLWSQMQILLLDMDPRFEAGYRELQQRHSQVFYEIAGAGPIDGTGGFDKTNDVGGVLDLSGANEGDTPIYTVDTLVKKHGLSAPYFLKFDTHGAEVDILRGCQQTLRDTALIQMEMYNFDLKFAEGRSLRFPDMFRHLETLGFRCIDIVDPLYRPGDQALWQFHGILIRADHPVFEHTGYSSGTWLT